jgi:hypothetical protein
VKAVALYSEVAIIECRQLLHHWEEIEEKHTIGMACSAVRLPSHSYSFCEVSHYLQCTLFLVQHYQFLLELFMTVFPFKRLKGCLSGCWNSVLRNYTLQILRWNCSWKYRWELWSTP